MAFKTSYLESTQTRFGFFLLLWDAYANSTDLFGELSVSAGSSRGLRRGSSGVFQFPAMPAGAQVFSVASNDDTPYYRVADVPITFPVGTGLWPAFPDIHLANRDLRLDDPAQPVEYRAQRGSVGLLPAIAYPFDASATLVRGSVLNGTDPLADATVSRVGGSEPAFVTGADGQFVLFFPRVAGMEENTTIRAMHASFADQDLPVTLLRGSTVSVTFTM